MNRRTGFTLIELLVVVLIIGILAAIALPQYRVAVARARIARALPLLKSIAHAKQIYYLTNGTYTADLDALDISIPYSGRDEFEDNTTSWIFHNTPIDDIRIAPNQGGVFWTEMSFNIVIDTYSDRQICYAQSDDGDRICASFGAPTGGNAWNGHPIYNVNF